MLILLDCRPLQKAGVDSEITMFITAVIHELRARQGVEWIFLLDKREDGLALPEDGKQLVRKTLPGGLGDELWYSWLIPRMARRERVDLVMTGGEPKAQGAGRAIKTPLCTWEMSEKGLVFSAGGVDVLAPLAPDEEVRSLSVEEREKWKEEAAGGREYFFADVAGMGASKIMNLLKAFSLFKKRQLSNMKLVLAGAGAIDKLDSYKYREDICLFPTGAKGLMEAAYAVIHTPRRNDPGIAVLNAWRAKTPVILLVSGTEGGKASTGAETLPGTKAPTGAEEPDGVKKPAGRTEPTAAKLSTGTKEPEEGNAETGAMGADGAKTLTGTKAPTGAEEPEAVFRVPEEDTAGLAEALKSLYKYEGIRNELVEKGASRVAGLSIRGSAAAIGALLGNVRSGG